MMITIFLSIMLGALVALFAVFLSEENWDRKFRKLIKSDSFLPPLGSEAVSDKALEDFQENAIAKIAASPKKISKKLEGFLESLKFHEKILDSIFCDKLGSPNHLAISKDFEYLISEVELRIRVLQKEESNGTSSN
ncbi:hypothetical protein [Leptospira santarosai]|uniref:hypothetical protein n=1 Tax=Leptospira santarosai TaxID=28183 RepID=UPI0002BE53C6|nr:hypothetical protein [Leptospira santarosai]EMP02306.1 hypothetical protein LEP1GSC171_0246 [Leptospira santarosai str. HAI1380]MDI7181707.1 hypothetical protein [Leptospira santarosai]